MKTLPVAVQVYSVRDDAERDFKGTIEKISAMGYQGVELAGLYNTAPEEIRKICGELNLKVVSAHVPFQDMIKDIHILDAYQAAGCQYIAVPYLEEENRPGTEGFAATMEEIVRIGKACNERGMTLLYHNHDFEFVRMENGEYGLDYLYSHIPADILQTELDTCWIKVAGEDPAAYVRKYKGRAPIVHLKDFYKEGNPQNMYELIGIETEKAEVETGVFEFRPVGHGLQDMPSILEASLEAGSEWVIVEQDSSVGRTPMEAIEMSREYLKSLGW